jgi:hypothetical protein
MGSVQRVRSHTRALDDAILEHIQIVRSISGSPRGFH